MSDPLYPATILLPMGSPGGVRVLLADIPGPLRPFAATLGVLSKPDGKKHDTTATKHTYQTNSETINDGTRSTDSVVDTDIDD